MKEQQKKRSVWDKIILFFLVIISCFIGWVGYSSFQYHLPFMDVARSTARYITLTAISVGVNVYDPTAAETLHARLGPDDADAVDNALPRIEKYLSGRGMPGVQLRDIQNEQIVTSSYDFSYQPDVPRLKEMREEMGLDAVVAGAGTELEKMIRLRLWVREQFSRLDYQKEMKKFDALTIWKNPQRNPLKKKKKSGNYNPCHFFPLFYSQVMLSMGYTPRVVHISYTGYDYHGFTEIWSNQYCKWVNMDPDLNLYYERDGIPQNMLDVHNARYEEKPQLNVVQVMVEPGVQPVETAENMIRYHQYIEVADLRNDWLTNAYFRGHPKRSDLATLTWKDMREPEIFRLTPTTSNVADMYWTLNQAEIHVQPKQSGQGRLALVFKTVTPNFSHFIVRVNGKEMIEKSSTFSWQLQEGDNDLAVYPVNSFGVEGISSKVVVRYVK